MTTRLAKHLARDYSQVLTAIFIFMLSNGIRTKDLWLVCTRAFQKAEEKARFGRLEESGDLFTASLVLDTWHRDRRYLNAKAVPKAVRLFGPAPSVEALIRIQRRGIEAPAIARHLKLLRLVVPCGRGLYKPTSDIAVISKHDPLVLQHAVRALSTLLETFTRNVTKSSSSAPLIERTAEVPDLPREHIGAFRKFTHLQGSLLLRTVNDWLESRRARLPRGNRSRSAFRAGVHLHAYVAGKELRSPRTRS
jgi:hypothetical protein